MVVPTSHQLKTRRGIFISPQYIIYAVVGSCILCLTFLADYFYTESLDGGAGALRGFKEEEMKVIKKEWGKPIKRPENWQTWGSYDVHKELKCEKHAANQNKPLPDMDYWNFVRDKRS